jgi:hypothetical protein
MISGSVPEASRLDARLLRVSVAKWVVKPSNSFFKPARLRARVGDHDALEQAAQARARREIGQRGGGEAAHFGAPVRRRRQGALAAHGQQVQAVLRVVPGCRLRGR